MFKHVKHSNNFVKKTYLERWLFDSCWLTAMSCCVLIAGSGTLSSAIGFEAILSWASLVFWFNKAGSSLNFQLSRSLEPQL